MNPTAADERSDRSLLSIAVVAVVLCVGTAFAQSVPAPSSSDARASREGAIELSPFVISAGTETGWVATETLAGTRLRTDLKDVANQVETLTREFMLDLGLTNLDQAMIYSINVENLRNDYLLADSGTDTQAPTTAGRFRGIATGTLSRNFFTVTNATDNFNLERVTLASGPNAILFGIGSPAGIIDATPARALLRGRKAGVEVQYDSENSRRGTFDFNTPIMPGRLALRLMGLSKREYASKKPNLDRDDRIYGTLTFAPLPNTTIVVQAERANRNINRASRYTPGDGVSLWFTANEIPGSGYSAPKPLFNNSNLTGIANNRVFNQAGNAPVFMIDGSVGPRSWRNSVVVRSPTTLPGTGPFDQTLDWKILDPSIFPFDVNHLGNEQSNLIRTDTQTVFLEQRLTKDLSLEFAYNHEKYYMNTVGVANEAVLRVDANQFVPGTTTPNPNVGKLYSEGTSNKDIEFQRRDDWRATLSYQLDLGQKLSAKSAIGKWLGRHQFSGMYSSSKSDFRRQRDFEGRILDEPNLPGITLRPRNLQNWAIDASRVPLFRHYYDNPGDLPPNSLSLQFTDASGRPYTLYQYDTPLVSADGKRLGTSTVPTGSLNRTETQVAVWQGFFLPDREKQSRVIATFGYRRDKGKLATFDTPSTRQDFSGLYPVVWDARFGAYGAAQTGINRNLGLVIKPLKWLNVFYSQSSTFDLSVGRFDPYGNDIPGTSGDGKDYGLRFDLLSNRLSVRVNRYDNSAGPVRSSQEIVRYRQNSFFPIEDRVLQLDPSLPRINVTDGNRRGFRVAGQAAYDISSDFRATGYELEINATPFRNWNLRLNGSKTDAVESNIGLPWFKWTAERLPVWQSVVAKNGEVDSSGRPVTWTTAPFSTSAPTGETLAQRYNNVILNGALAYMAAADGRATNTHPLRLNFVTNYRFSDGRLNGFNVGGAVRWRAAPVIGYGVKKNSGGNDVLDIDRKYKGAEETYFDAVFGYKGTLKAFGGLNYRAQLNVRNLLNEDEPIAAGTITTGKVTRIATVEPRTILYSFAVDF